MKNIAAALFFTESLVGYKQPCQPVYDKTNLDAPLFIAIVNVAFDTLTLPILFIQALTPDLPYIYISCSY